MAQLDERYTLTPARRPNRHQAVCFTVFEPFWAKLSMDAFRQAPDGRQIYPPLATDAEPCDQELYVVAHATDGQVLQMTTRVAAAELAEFVGGLEGMHALVGVRALEAVHREAQRHGRYLYRVDMRWFDAPPLPAGDTGEG